MSGGFFTRLLDFLFPPKCTFCRRFLKKDEKYICEHCLKNLPFSGCRKKTGDFFSLCVSPLFYRDDVRKSILRYKFKGASNYAACYGKILADCIKERLNEPYDYITWVPLSRARMRKRGYDQAALLAMATALELDCVAVDLLKKTIDVPAQSGVGAAEKRKANVSGVYEALEPDIIKGKNILIIDDVVTTGATLSECSRVLLMAGAEKVFCAALATTEGD